MNYINYNSEKIPVKFSYRTIKNIKDTLGADLTRSNEDLSKWFDDFSNQEHLFFEMITEGYRQEKRENPYQFADMEDILSQDNMYADLLKIYSDDAITFLTPSSKTDKKKETLKVVKEA